MLQVLFRSVSPLGDVDPMAEEETADGLLTKWRAAAKKTDTPSTREEKNSVREKLRDGTPERRSEFLSKLLGDHRSGEFAVFRGSCQDKDVLHEACSAESRRRHVEAARLGCKVEDGDESSAASVNRQAGAAKATGASDPEKAKRRARVPSRSRSRGVGSKTRRSEEIESADETCGKRHQTPEQKPHHLFVQDPKLVPPEQHLLAEEAVRAFKEFVGRLSPELAISFVPGGMGGPFHAEAFAGSQVGSPGTERHS